MSKIAAPEKKTFGEKLKTLASNQIFIPVAALLLLVLFNLIADPGFFKITLGQNSNGDPVLSIYTITGENRETRGRMGARIVLRRQTATVYAAELYDAGVYYGMNEELLRKSFSLITGSWIN